eukprot:scaffold102478_cov63-Phaeocystis_antarctica.AAC.4
MGWCAVSTASDTLPSWRLEHLLQDGLESARDATQLGDDTTRVERAHQELHPRRCLATSAGGTEVEAKQLRRLFPTMEAEHLVDSTTGQVEDPLASHRRCCEVLDASGVDGVGHDRVGARGKRGE